MGIVETKIVKKKIKDLLPAPYNPRIISDEELNKLKESIKTFGCIDLMVHNVRTGHIVGGNQRWRSLKELGYEEIEVIEVDLSLGKEKLLNIAMNKISGRFDEEKLATILEEIIQLPDFDVGLTGFELPEISSLFDRYLSHDGEDDFDVKKEAETITEPVTQRGDIIELGSHRLLCGDSAELEDLEKLFQAKKADLVVGDPPYNCAYLNVRPVQKKGGKK